LYRLAEGRFWRLRRQPWTQNGALRPTWLWIEDRGFEKWRRRASEETQVQIAVSI